MTTSPAGARAHGAPIPQRPQATLCLGARAGLHLTLAVIDSISAPLTCPGPPAGLLRATMLRRWTRHAYACAAAALWRGGAAGWGQATAEAQRACVAVCAPHDRPARSAADDAARSTWLLNANDIGWHLRREISGNSGHGGAVRRSQSVSNDTGSALRIRAPGRRRWRRPARGRCRGCTGCAQRRPRCAAPCPAARCAGHTRWPPGTAGRSGRGWRRWGCGRA